MGIKLDWEIESEQSEVRAAEDPSAKRRRRQARRRLILLVVALMAIVGGVAALIVWRLDEVDNQLRQDLIDTVEVEVTALRVGDFANFMAIQRSASDAFMLEQSSNFDSYQELKQTHRVQLTGAVQDVAIEDRTGRVIVEEIIDGIPYHVVWFYWYYEDAGTDGATGWRRVPDNFAFWGDAATIRTENTTIHFQELDRGLAEGLAPSLQTWWTTACRLLACPTLPPDLTVEIVAERPGLLDWSQDDPWVLRIPSPLVGRARADVAVAPEMERAVTGQIAARLVRYVAGDAQFDVASDAAWIADDLARWLDDRLLYGDGVDSPVPGFVDSLIVAYGPGVPVNVAGALQPSMTVADLFLLVSGVPFEQLNVDSINALRWTGYFQARLDLENELLAAGDVERARTLYDLDDPQGAAEAEIRLSSPAYAAQDVPQVNAVTLTWDAVNRLIAQVEVTRTENGQISPATLRWHLTGGTWKRVS